MDIANVIALVSGIGAILSGAFATLVWRSAKRRMIHEALLDVQKDYRSPQMLYAVRTLWDFYREHKEKLVETYEEIRNEEERWVSSLDRQERIKAEEHTLHHQRRLVSHFYQHLASLYLSKILPRDILYRNWSEPDLRIIPQILIPIENKLREVLFTPPLKPLDESCSLLVLYRDSKDCSLLE